MESTISFKLINSTSIAVMHGGKNIIGHIYSDHNGMKPYPHNDHESTLESIQICGFSDASKIWPCGKYHGNKDIVLRFNIMEGKFYDSQKAGYSQYVNACLKQNKPQLIKSFNDWVSHMGHPTDSVIRNLKGGDNGQGN